MYCFIFDDIGTRNEVCQKSSEQHRLRFPPAVFSGGKRCLKHKLEADKTLKA